MRAQVAYQQGYDAGETAGVKQGQEDRREGRLRARPQGGLRRGQDEGPEGRLREGQDRGLQQGFAAGQASVPTTRTTEEEEEARLTAASRRAPTASRARSRDRHARVDTRRTPPGHLGGESPQTVRIPAHRVTNPSRNGVPAAEVPGTVPGTTPGTAPGTAPGTIAAHPPKWVGGLGGLRRAAVCRACRLCSVTNRGVVVTAGCCENGRDGHRPVLPGLHGDRAVRDPPDQPADAAGAGDRSAPALPQPGARRRPGGVLGALAAVPYYWLIGEVGEQTALVTELLLLGLVAVWAVLAAAVLVRDARRPVALSATRP